MVEGLNQAPSVLLKCGHIFHVHCQLERLKKRWPGPRIVFNFLHCSECKARIEAPQCIQIHNELKEAWKIEEEVRKKALERSKHEGIDKNPELQDRNSIYFNDLQNYSMFKLAYYQCFKCKCAYFGGLKDCLRAQQEGQEYKPEELVCSKCSASQVGAGVVDCKKHGTDYIEFKCKFCCTIA